MTTRDQLWGLLRRVRALSFVAQSRAETGWNGRGAGSVLGEIVGDGAMTFSESGSWRPERGGEIRFHNVFRWSVVGDVLRLEHLRFGADNPVHLFDLAQVGEREWRPASPHVCREDCYSAILLVGDDQLVLRWSIDGPRKRETIKYAYTWPRAA